MELVAIVSRYGLAWLGGAWFGYPTLASCKTAFNFSAWHGEVGLGWAGHGKAWLQRDRARQIPDSFLQFRHGTARLGMVRRGEARRGMATTWTRTRQKSETLFYNFGEARRGAARRGRARRGKAGQG